MDQDPDPGFLYPNIVPTRTQEKKDYPIRTKRPGSETLFKSGSIAHSLQRYVNLYSYKYNKLSMDLVP